MAKKLTINGKVAMFQMSLKGGKLPDNFEAFIDVKMSFEDAQPEDLFKVCASGQSARVALQSQLRVKTPKELKALEENGLTVKFNDIIAGRVTKPIDAIMALDLDDFVELMTEKLDMEYEDAVLLYNKKHDIVEEE